MMKKKSVIKDKNLRALSQDPDFRVEEIIPKDKKEAEGKSIQGEKAAKPPRLHSLRVFAVVLAALLCLGLCFAGGSRRADEGKLKNPDKVPSEELVSVTEAEKDQRKAEEKGTDQKTKVVNQTQKTETKETSESGSTQQSTEKPAGEESVKKEPAMVQDTSWQEIIFGDDRKAVITAPIAVEGLTENEKNLTGFRESDFIRSLSAFLGINNIRTSTVTFTGSIACSAGEAAAYTADLKNVSDRKLVVLFFPAFPGKYLFALETVQKEKKAETAPKETERKTEIVTTAAQPAVVQNQQPQTKQETEAEYDAMRLSLKNMSSELSNYLSNPYEMQYGLYDYLFNRGIKNASIASVTDYYIDSEERTATIQVSIEGIGKATVIYHRDDNSYIFQ